jgi:Arc/MetJ-type ribon-helix-helix transcriptional regulator
MDVVLPSDWAKYVDTLVEKEEFSNSSEVIAEALRQFRVSRPAYSVVMTPALERLLDEGMEDLDEAATTDELRRQ